MTKPRDQGYGIWGEHQGPRAVLNAVDRLARGYGLECDRFRQELVVAEGQLRDYQARVGQPFPHDAYLSQLAALRDQLKSGLSGAQPQEGEPTVAELAERIKALKAAHSIEATPQRVRQKRSSAEEPVTARIRRKTAGISPSEAAVEAGALADPVMSPLPEPTALDNAGQFPPGTPSEYTGMDGRGIVDRVRKNVPGSLGQGSATAGWPGDHIGLTARLNSRQTHYGLGRYHE